MISAKKGPHATSDTGLKKTNLTRDPRRQKGPARERHRPTRARWSAIRPRSDQRRFVQVEDGSLGRHQPQRLQSKPQRIGIGQEAHLTTIDRPRLRKATGVVMMLTLRAILWALALTTAIWLRRLIIVPVPGSSVVGCMMMLVLMRMTEVHNTDREPGENTEHHQPCQQTTHDVRKRHSPTSASGFSGRAWHLALPASTVTVRFMPVAEPSKELRFTRAGQAAGFWIAAATLAMAALVFFLLTPHRAENPELPHPAWGLIPLILAVALARLGWHCTRHAYLILSPIGVEVFPLLRPAATMQVIPWQQIDSAEIAPLRLTLHFNTEKSAGIHLSLSPIAKDRRELLAKAILGRFPS